MNLLETLDDLLLGWRPSFAQVRTFERARRLTFGLLVCLRRHLTSQAICVTGRQSVDWTSDYHLCTRCWDPRPLFDPVFDRLSSLLSSPDAPVVVAVDETLCRKSGKKKIPGVSLARDPGYPLGPPAFRVNFCYGLRFVQLSVLIAPRVPGPARALPVRFELAPPAEKPKKGASAEAQAAYRQQRKKRALTVVGRQAMSSVRQSMDQREELHYRRLILCGDGSYTSGNVLNTCRSGPPT